MRGIEGLACSVVSQSGRLERQYQTEIENPFRSSSLSICVFQSPGAIIVFHPLEPVFTRWKIPLTPYQSAYEIVFAQRLALGREDARTRQLFDASGNGKEACQTVEKEGACGPVCTRTIEKADERISGAEMRPQVVQAGEEDECDVRIREEIGDFIPGRQSSDDRVEGPERKCHHKT